MITNISHLPPLIQQHFDQYLLLGFLDRSLKRLNEKIQPLSHKKIRLQDVGKFKEYSRLLMEYLVTYERKKAEEEIYKIKIRELAEKVPRIPTSGTTMRFTRMDSGK